MKEATKWCRDLGLNYEFIQTQVADEFGLFKAVVQIIDKKNNRMAEWPTARLSVWLDLIRDNTDINTENVFQSVDVVWSELPQELGLNESLNSSKISLNLSAIKDALFGNPIKSFFKNKIDSPLNQSQQSLKQQKTEPIIKSGNRTEKRASNLIEKFNNLAEGVSTSTPTEEALVPELQRRLRNLRKELAGMKNLCKKETDQNKDMQTQRIANNVLKALDEIEPLTIEIRSLLKNTESGTTPCKPTKTVRFIID